ncbi:MAG: trypsin-like peptidase domain-containing protein [Thermogutta sp.]
MTRLRMLLPLSVAQEWIRDGDLLLFRRRGVIAAIGRGEHSHAALAGWWGNTLCCLEVRGRYGGRVVTLASQVARYPGQIDVFLADPDDRWPEFDRQQTVQTMLQFAGRPYGYRTFLRVALRHIPGLRLFLSPKTNDAAANLVGPICSEACVLATRVGGGVDPVPQLADELTEPADLARSPFYRYRATLIPDVESESDAARPKQLPADRPAWSRFFTFIGLLSLVLFVSSGTLKAQTCPAGSCRIPAVVGQLPTQPPAVAGSSVPSWVEKRLAQATARLSNQVSSGMMVYGTGVLVARDDHQGWILTCDHLFREGIGRVTVVFPAGPGWRGFEGRVVARDPQADLALLAIALPQATPIPLAETYPAPGEPVVLAGYGRTGRFHIIPGQVLGYVASNLPQVKETLQIRGAAEDGDSGGPIVNAAGELVAVTWGTDGFRSVGTYCGRIRAFLRAFLPGGDAQMLGVTPAPPPAPVPTPAPQLVPEGPLANNPPVADNDPAQTPSQEPPQSGSLLDRLQQRLESLQGKIAATESGQQSLSERFRTLEAAIGVVSDLRQRVEKAEQTVGRENVRAVIRETVADLLRDRGDSWLNAVLPAVVAALGWTGPPSLALAFAARLALKLLERRLRTANLPAQPATDKQEKTLLHPPPG